MASTVFQRTTCIVFALAPILAFGDAAHASEDTVGMQCELDIRRQPLGGALQQLARQCGLQIIFFSSMTEGLAAPAIDGGHSLASAMDQLLDGSGLTYRVINGRTVEVRQQRARPSQPDGGRGPAPELSVTSGEPVPRGPVAAPEIEEVVVVGVAEQLVATRVATPLRDIPQTVSVVTSRQLKLQNSTNLSDALRLAPGITLLRNSSLDVSFYARAHQVTAFHIDGGAAIDPQLEGAVLFLGTPDLSEFDHVEILRGSDGLFGGNATPGGTVSLARKRAQRNFATTFDATAGSWNRRRLELDVTGPLALDGALRGRADVVYSSQEYFFDSGPHERKKIFAALEYDVTPGGTLTVGGSQQWDDAELRASAIPLWQDGADSHFPRSTSLSFDWNRYRSRLSEVYLQYRQDFGDSWALKVNSAGWRATVDYAFGYFLGPLGVNGPGLGSPHGSFSASPNVHDHATADMTFMGTTDWFGGRQEVAVGADFTRFVATTDKFDIFYFGEALDDPYVSHPGSHADPRGAYAPDQEVKGMRSRNQYGLFASLRAYVGEALSLTGGARLSADKQRWDITTSYGEYGEYASEKTERTEGVVTPFAGVIYDLTPHYSIYASYADIYQRMGMHERPSGRRLGPVHGINIEAGIKAQWREGALNGSLVFYRVEQRNIPQGVPNDPDNPNESPECCSRGATSRSRGVDMGLEGEARPGWVLGAGYSYNVNRSHVGGALSDQTPRHMLKAWISAPLPGTDGKWHIGGNVHAQSKASTRETWCSPDGCSIVAGAQRPYAILDLRAAYEVAPAWQVTLGLNNVFDKIYYESIGSPSMHAWYGEPRNWTLRIDGRR